MGSRETSPVSGDQECWALAQGKSIGLLCWNCLLQQCPGQGQVRGLVTEPREESSVAHTQSVSWELLHS